MFEIIYDTYAKGGFVIIPIFSVGFWGFCLVLGTYFNLGAGLWKVNLNPIFDKIKILIRQRNLTEVNILSKKTPYLIRYGIEIVTQNSHLPERALRRLLEEKLAMALHGLERHLPLIRVMAAAAPLMGLLGTVSGLIHTFKVMNEYGNGNPTLLADGISEALIATQSGLLLAIVLILLGQRLEGRVQWLQNQVEYLITLMLNELYGPESTPMGRQK